MQRKEYIPDKEDDVRRPTTQSLPRPVEENRRWSWSRERADPENNTEPLEIPGPVQRATHLKMIEHHQKDTLQVQVK